MLVETTATISLLLMTEATLRAIANDEAPSIPEFPVADGALPPPYVAARSLRFLESGCPPEWALPLHIIATTEQMVVGVCLFKGLPVSGAVEIGYAVAPSFRGRGFAAAAVRQMLLRASNSAQVREVFALISPENVASSAVAARADFRQGLAEVDDNGGVAVRWHWRCVA